MSIDSTIAEIVRDGVYSDTRFKTLTNEIAELQQKLDAMTKKHAELCAWSTVREIKCNDLIKAARAVIDRWDSPNWKDQAHTGEYIHALRKAVQTFES